MNWLFQLPTTQPVAHAIGVISVVCMSGMALGSVKVRGVGLGTAGVLFAGIITGHFGKPVNKSTLDFVREFGLILFIFTIGLQLGPGFFAALRTRGLTMNALALAIIVLGALGAPLIGWLAGVDPAAVLGIFSGASINMPSLGAATQTLNTLPNISPDRLALPALACAVSFPTAILGSIGVLLLLKRIFRINPKEEAAALAATLSRPAEPLERRTLAVTNPNLDGLRLGAVPGRKETCVSISRVRHDLQTLVATDATVIHLNDRIAVIGERAGIDQFERVVGRRTDEDLLLGSDNIATRRVLVTDGAVIGKTIGELKLNDRLGVAVTRVTRGDIEMSAAVPGLRLQFGDTLQIVGRDADLHKAATALGNSLRELNETHFIPLFIGIILGIVVGTLPITVPGLRQPVRLGLAGGPLIVALVLGRVGHIGRQVCHMPLNANLAFREFGIALFFTAVGLDAGPTFFATVVSSTGVKWMLAGLCVTVVPLLLIGIFARIACRMNFIDLSGLLSGSMTNPPALTFATSTMGSDGPTIAYATVYPLTMLLRIVAAQTLAMLLCR
jgi:putative transport protein